MPMDDNQPGMLPDSYFRGWHHHRARLEHFLGTQIGQLVKAALLALFAALLALAVYLLQQRL